EGVAWRNDRIDAALKYLINALRSRQQQAIGPCSKVSRVSQIPARRVGNFEKLLAIVRHLSRTMPEIEIDQVRKRAHRCMRQPGQVLRDLYFEFRKQYGELVTGIRKDVARVAGHHGRSQCGHRVKTFIE